MVSSVLEPEADFCLCTSLYKCKWRKKNHKNIACPQLLCNRIGCEWPPIVHSLCNTKLKSKLKVQIKMSLSRGLRNKDVNFIIPFKMLSLVGLFFLLWWVEVITVCFGVESSYFKELLIVWLHVKTSSVHHVAFYSFPPGCCTCCYFSQMPQVLSYIGKNILFSLFLCACLSQFFPFSCLGQVSLWNV